MCAFAEANRHLLDYLKLIAPEDTAGALAEVDIETVALAPDTLGGEVLHLVPFDGSDARG